MYIKSYAKINLSLRVLSVREDGYHNLEMVNLPLGLHDAIEIDRDPYSSDTFITCDDIGLNNTRHNLCSKAVDAMRAEFHFKENFNIRIHKEIPFAAGLGGGSSNAAAVIKGLVELLKIKTDEETLIRIGTSIGADVPFFFLNEPALVTGIGENISPISVKKNYACLIVKPVKGLSTTSVFAIADKFPRLSIDTGSVIDGLANDDQALIAKSIGNDLYAPSASLLDDVRSIVESLKKDGFAISGMSGSGSACFALSRDIKKIKEAAKNYIAKGYIVKTTMTL